MAEYQTLAELRPLLIKSRERVGEILKHMKPCIESHAKAKTEYERAFARAKVYWLTKAETKEDKTPTMINARAELDPEVQTARDKLDLEYAKLTAYEAELKAADEDCKAIKKAMSTIEAEMHSFGG